MDDMHDFFSRYEKALKRITEIAYSSVFGKITYQFESQAKSGFNSYGYYQFGSNCCVYCKRDRPIKEESIVCDICKEYQKIKNTKIDIQIKQ